VDALLNDLRARAGEARKRGLSGRFAEDFALGADGALAHQHRETPYVRPSAPAPAPQAPAPQAPPEAMPEADASADAAEGRNGSPL
jgi:NADH-quinone oxidoreductase subunit E